MSCSMIGRLSPRRSGGPRPRPLPVAAVGSPWRRTATPSTRGAKEARGQRVWEMTRKSLLVPNTWRTVDVFFLVIVVFWFCFGCVVMFPLVNPFRFQRATLSFMMSCLVRRRSKRRKKVPLCSMFCGRCWVHPRAPTHSISFPPIPPAPGVHHAMGHGWKWCLEGKMHCKPSILLLLLPVPF